MAKGTVKWFDNKKGYGFISASEGGKDLFVHMNEIKMEGYKTLKEQLGAPGVTIRAAKEILDLSEK